MKLSELLENYREAQGIEDFAARDVIYRRLGDNFTIGKVESVSPCLCVKWNDCAYNVTYTSSQLIYLYVQGQELDHNFKVGDRVVWLASDDLTGTIAQITNNFIHVLWSSNSGRLSEGTYSKEWWSSLKPIQEPKVTKEITLESSRSKLLSLDIKLNFNLDTTGIETVLVDCVKALVSNSKYQEAKELCELLVSVQSLGKAQEKTEDDSTEGA